MELDTAKNKIEIVPGRVVSFRPTLYDVVILESIASAHPQLTDVGDLIRQALGEYQALRKEGSKHSLLLQIFDGVKLLIADRHQMG